MSRLNKKAFKIIANEIAKAADRDKIAGEVSQKIARQRLKELRSSKGKPVTEAELKHLIGDLFLDFDPKAIKKAVRANRPSNSLWLIPKMAVGLGGLAGVIWILNLPYPMIRRPVAKTAPIVLLPSYLKMDRNYRQAIAHLPKSVDRSNRDRAAKEISVIINFLEEVKPQTTVYADAASMMNFANRKLKQLSSGLE